MLKKIITVSAVVALVTVSSMAQNHQKGHGNRDNQHQVVESSTSTGNTLSEIQIAGLSYMAEEEKIARDVYLHLAKTTGQRIFSRIAKSEQKHIDAVLRLLSTYNIDVPSTMDEAGIYLNEELQDLYNRLIAVGDNSLKDAYTVGVIIEEKDIADLEELLAEDDIPTDIETSYSRLLKGSYNHLRAFNRQLNK